MTLFAISAPPSIWSQRSGPPKRVKITEYKDVRGYILFRKPEHIRIIGLYPVVRNKAFDMVSDGSTFRLYIPAKNRFVTGRNELTVLSKNKLENLRPQHFLEALMVRPWDSQNEKVVLQNLTDEDNAAYILHFLAPKPDGDLSLRRQVWFSRLNLRIARELIFDPDGNILTDARYSDWQEYDRVPFPKRIDITRPRDEYALVLTLVKMDINKNVEAAKFQLEQPPGSVLQALGEGQKEEAAEENSNGGNRKR